MRDRPIAVRALLLVLGLAVVVVGSEYLVDGAVEIALDPGASDAVIGLTIVAVGTSAPELVLALDLVLMVAAAVVCVPVFGRNSARIADGR